MRCRYRHDSGYKYRYRGIQIIDYYRYRQILILDIYRYIQIQIINQRRDLPEPVDDVEDDEEEGHRDEEKSETRKNYSFSADNTKYLVSLQ